MSTSKLSRKRKSSALHDETPWAVLVAEAEERVRKAKRLVTELELVLKTIRRDERQGTSWPIKEPATLI